MAGASDKARFYLEQYVPELQEYERKEIFSRDEISAIASKRSDFEHILNARGSKPSDYARYATYEMNLDSLRKKRCKRLGVKSTTFSGQRTIFFILDRGTRKFPGDMGLWMQYINFCQREKANKKLAKVLTSVLRLKPRDYGLWVLAAKYYAETQGDMNTARSYMQRGLRFCKDERKLWLEYMRLEMVYLAKLAARRKILGLDEKPAEPHVTTSGDDEDMLMLPAVTAEDIDPDATRAVDGVDADALQKLASAPAFTGAIPIAIFDSSMKQFKSSAQIGEEFFEVCASFDQVPSTRKILQHIVDAIQSTSPTSAEAAISEARLELFSFKAQSSDFPAALGASLSTIRKAQMALKSNEQRALAEKTVLMLSPYMKDQANLDEDVVRVIEASIRRYVRLIPQVSSETPDTHASNAISEFLRSLRKSGKDAEAEVVESYAKALDLG